VTGDISGARYTTLADEFVGITAMEDGRFALSVGHEGCVLLQPQGLALIGQMAIQQANTAADKIRALGLPVLRVVSENRLEENRLIPGSGAHA
jgi:hypothetical protein